MIGRQAREHALKELERRTDELLSVLGFQRAGRCEWRRSCEWKIEVVELMPNRGDTVILPSFSFLLPRSEPQGASTHHHIAFANVDALVNPERSPKYTKLPSVMFKIHTFLERTVEDITTALPWFDQFSDPEMSIKNLPRHLKPGCPAYIDAMSFLGSLLRKGL